MTTKIFKKTEIAIICNEFDFQFRGEFQIKDIEKQLKKLNRKKGKVWVTGSKRDFLTTMIELWEDDIIIISENNGPEAFCKFIYDNFSIPHETNKQKTLSLSSIQSEVYKLKR